MPHPVETLASRYPQLCFPIQSGISSTEEYRNVCLKGHSTYRSPEFNTTAEDSLETVSTSAGDVEILYLANRDDFVHAYRALGFKCEPVNIPSSCGAVTFLKLNNFEKIRALSHPLALSDPSLYNDTLILLSKGPYSGVPADAFNFDSEKWINDSYTIRKYHELTHFISRNNFPDNKEDIRDEVMADMIGLMFAYGRYDTFMARRFLGINVNPCLKDGRLHIYIKKGGSPDDAALRANAVIDCFAKNLPGNKPNPFDILTDFETRKLAL